MLLFGMRRRAAGKPIPSWQLNTHRFELGHLLINDQHRPELNRTVRVARFVSADLSGADLWPELTDVQLLLVKPSYMVLQGLEHSALHETDMCQVWLLHAADPDAGSASKTPDGH